jgi:hypothetical protein
MERLHATEIFSQTKAYRHTTYFDSISTGGFIGPSTKRQERGVPLRGKAENLRNHALCLQ